MSEHDRYLIWSFEHDAWWGPNECGYVRSWDWAGHYTYARAREICGQANHSPEVLHETFIPLSALTRRGT